MQSENGQALCGPQWNERYRAMVSSTMQKLTEPLPPEQYKALGLITEGEPIRVAAQKVGVDRGTVYRWIRNDPRFRAAYNARQLEQRESCRVRLLAAADKAVDQIIERVKYDEKLAFALAKELGLFGAPKNQAVDPRRVRHEIILEQWAQEELMEKRCTQQLVAKKNRRLLELDVEDIVTEELAEAEMERGVAQVAINDNDALPDT